MGVDILTAQPKLHFRSSNTPPGHAMHGDGLHTDELTCIWRHSKVIPNLWTLKCIRITSNAAHREEPCAAPRPPAAAPQSN